MRVDIFQNDRRRVNHHADCQRDTHHGHVVDGNAQVGQNAEAADKAHGHGNNRDECGAECLQEKQHQQRAENDRLNDVAADAVHGPPDEV